MSLCLAHSEGEDDSFFSLWNIYHVPGPKPSTLHAFSHLIIMLLRSPFFTEQEAVSQRGKAAFPRRCS